MVKLYTKLKIKILINHLQSSNILLSLNIKPQCILPFPIKSIFYLHKDSEPI